MDHIDRLITEEAIDLYRQDFAYGATGAWRANDADDRQGITENRYVAGYLAYLDELRRRHPDMLIDMCAAGGKRLDLEDMRRAVPLWRSDYVYEPVGTQSHTYGLSFWIPFHGTGTGATDPYVFRSNMTSSINCVWDVRDMHLPYDLLRRLVAQWREVAPNYLGDYYPLTPYRRDGDVWMAWQFHRPEVGKGVLQAFRRDDSSYVTSALQLRGLEPGSLYETVDLDDPESATRMTGAELMEQGLTVTIPEKPGAALITYAVVE